MKNDLRFRSDPDREAFWLIEYGHWPASSFWKPFAYSSYNIELPIPTSTLTKNSIIHEGKKLFNHLPLHIKQIETERKFRKSVKKFLLEKRVIISPNSIRKRFLIIKKCPCNSSFRYRYSPAADALINQKCSVNLKKGDSIPKKHQHDIPNEQTNSGVAGQNGRAVARRYRTLPVRRMHKKLEEYFSDDIMILRQKDRANIIVTGKTVVKIICDYQRQKCSEDTDAEEFRIVEATAKLIKNSIKLMRTS
ncbi:unnamed protein product [Phaedon cochleariae]|uniref:Uncharacterized protein n=1 Tax=Phaedon cochleariae TaxID=80249 RepID=A0A9N9SCD6_PHACE|nr:unnamed protein product [Phaedon cochleariae]